MPVRLIARDGKILDSEIRTFAFAFYPGGFVAFRNGVEVTGSEAMMCLAECMVRAIDEADASAAEALAQQGALR